MDFYYLSTEIFRRIGLNEAGSHEHYQDDIETNEWKNAIWGSRVNKIRTKTIVFQKVLSIPIIEIYLPVPFFISDVISGRVEPVCKIAQAQSHLYYCRWMRKSVDKR